MAPGPGPCISEPTLRVGFCTALDSVGAVAGHGPAGKKPRIPRRGARLGGCTPPRPPKKKSPSPKRGKTPGETVFPAVLAVLHLQFGSARTPVTVHSLVARKAGLFSQTYAIPCRSDKDSPTVWDSLCFCKERFRKNLNKNPRPGLPRRGFLWKILLVLFL